MTTKKEDTIRVLRVYEFTGPRSLVEAQVAKSIHGDKDVGNGVVIKGATIGTYPEILNVPSPEPEPTRDAKAVEEEKVTPKPYDRGYLQVRKARHKTAPVFGYVNHGQGLSELQIVDRKEDASLMTRKDSLHLWGGLAGSGDWMGWDYYLFVVDNNQQLD